MYSYGYARNRRPIARGFGGLGGFKERQATRDAYNALADWLRDTAPSMPPSIRAAVELYVGHTRSVIVRGAQYGDLLEIRAKIAEWEKVILQQAAAERAAVTRVVAEQQAAALKAEARIVAEQEGQSRVAAATEAAATAAALRATAAAAVEQQATIAASEARVRADVPLEARPVESYIQPLKAGLLDNPLLIVVAAGALIFLLKK